MSKELELSESSYIKVTYSVLIAFLIGVAGFTAWMTRIESRTTANVESIEKVENTTEVVKETLISIDRRLYSIEQLLKASGQKRGD